MPVKIGLGVSVSTYPLSTGAPTVLRPFVLPAEYDWDLLYYAPGLTQQALSSGALPTVGQPLVVTGAANEYVTEGNYMVYGAPGWTGATAYIFEAAAAVPQEILAIFKVGSASATPPTIGLTLDGSGQERFLHCQLNSGTGGAIPEILSAVLSAGGTVVDGLQYVTQDLFGSLPVDEWLTMRVRILGAAARIDVTKLDGTVLGKCYAIDAGMQDTAGSHIFIELFGGADTDLRYGFLGARSVADLSDWDALGILVAETMQSAPSAAFGVSPFGGSGGSAAYNTVNKTWDVAGGSFGQGGAVSLGAVEAGDVIEILFDVTAITEAAINDAVAFLGYEWGVGSDTAPIGATTGAKRVTLTASSTAPEMLLVLGTGAGGGAVSMSLRNITVIRNGVTLAASWYS